MISLIVPVHNEGAWLDDLVQSIVMDMRTQERPFDLWLVNNGSRDNSRARLASLAERYAPQVHFLESAIADYGEAIVRGLSASKGEVKMVFDLDAWDFDFVRAALERLESAEMVVGYKKWTWDGRSLQRRLVTLGHHLVVWLVFPKLWGLDVHGPLALKDGALQKDWRACRFRGDAWKAEFLMRALISGRRCVSQPVATREVRPARTPLGRRVWGYGSALGRLWFYFVKEKREVYEADKAAK